MRTDSSQHWISKTLEGTYNTPESTGSNYSFVPTNDAFFLLPEMEKRNDAQRIGRNAASHVCNEYWKNSGYQLKDDIETGVPARLFRRALGGSVADTTVATGVYNHVFSILSPQVGSILPPFSMASLLGSASFLFAGMMVDRFKVSQKNSERAVYEADIVGSGKFTKPHGLSSLPALVTPPCMDGFRTVVTYDDANDQPVDLSSAGTIIEWSVEHKNNIRQNKRRTGDTIQTVGTYGSAAHVKSMPRGRYTTDIMMMVDFVDLTDWQSSAENASFSNLTFKMVGPLIDATHRYEFEITVPFFSFEMVSPGSDAEDAATQIKVIPYQDPTTGGTITGRVKNATATLV